MSFVLTALGWLGENFIGSLVEKLADFTVQFGAKEELQDHLIQLKTSLHQIQFTISRAENIWIQDEDLRGRFSELLIQLKDGAYDADDLLDEFHFRALQQQAEQRGDKASHQSSSSSSSLPSRKKRRLSSLGVAIGFFGRENDDDDVNRVREIQGRLGRIADAFQNVMASLDAYGRRIKQLETSEVRRTSSVPIATQMFGRDKELKELIELLLQSPHGSPPSCNHSVSVLAIVGIGGVGKTTLSQIACIHESMEKYFKHKIWVDVSDGFSVERITKEIIESATQSKCDSMNFDTLQKNLKQLTSDRFLLVLDDVRNAEKHKWESLCAPLRWGAAGSKILVTTRSTKIADIVGHGQPIHLKCLDEESYWAFFRKCAFGSQNPGDHPQLEAIAKKIVRKLGGLPLAARTLGALLSVRMDEQHWRSIMECEIWELPQEEDDVLPVLRISYQHLPAHLKRCFAFCSLFPRDYRFNEDRLIQIWMAEGFIGPPGNMRMEDLGRHYFQELVSRSFFQKSQNPHWSYYEMHDLIHDLARLISAGESSRLHSDDSREFSCTLRHLSLFAKDVEPERLMEVPDPSKFKLRTLMLSSERRVKSYSLPLHLLERLKNIRVLILQNCGMKKLPETIDDLVHLRYLDISENTSIQRLPESLCDLHNLQTLILQGCQLQSFPQGMSKLMKLRKIHAEDEIISKINEVGKLTSLQELTAFGVLKDQGRQIAELSGLTQLHGTLRIRNLENVGSKEEARKAGLNSKAYLVALELEWVSDQHSNLQNSQLLVSEEVLEGLQPHQALKSLVIRGYNGARSPSWLEAKLLPNLEMLTLRNCKRWNDFSCIGPIPRLKVLRMKGLSAAKVTGHGFFGATEQGKCFPMLEELVIGDMAALEELSWNDGRVLFPCLSKLEIQECPKLQRLSPLPPSLTKLELGQVGLTEFTGLWEGIDGSSMVSERNLRNIKTIDIWGCEELVSLPVKRFRELTSLENLSIQSCLVLMSTTRDEDIELLLPPSVKQLDLIDCGDLGKSLPACLHNLASLTELEIRGCPYLMSLPKEQMLHLKQLKCLSIKHCDELTSVEGLRVLNSLRFLTIFRCPKLLVNEGDRQGEVLPLEQLEVDDTALLKLWPIRDALPSLRRLAIISSPQTAMFDGEEQELLRSLTAVRSLQFSCCRNLQTLPTELHAIPFLWTLWIEECPEIRSLPEKGLPSSLAYLQVDDCHPMLAEQVEKQVAEMKSSGRWW
ncbi:NB-ARC domain [Musa troglodytarum]|uniref:NB-ARC domain n=1 Tax=Musa troglodytarum TaxID=320322 RepID=A0A9E7KRD7_9LILI|nr:NB-ARC domain [Musa troglodytarum]